MDGCLIAAAKPLGQFLERYIICEAIARKLIADKTKKLCPHAFKFKQIESALKHFDLEQPIHLQLVEQIFRSGDGIRSSKTPRQLRNAIVHGVTEEDCSEVQSRHSEFNESNAAVAQPLSPSHTIVGIINTVLP